MTNQNPVLTPKEKFNAYSNADHIFALKSADVSFKILDMVAQEDECKAVIMTEEGEIKGLYTDSKTAMNALKELIAVFGEDQPMVKVNLKETAKGASVYYFEVV